MKRVRIIVEGTCEEEFVKQVLYNHFLSFGITDVRPIKIATSKSQKGGMQNYDRYKRDVNNYLTKERNIIVTSFIDFFRLPTNFPKYKEAEKLNGSINQVICLEEGLTKDIDHRNFIPYIQLHEFEALLFASKKGFKQIENLITEKNKIALQAIFTQYSNPEMINGGADKSPSNRILNLMPSYQKTTHGIIVAKENGINTILDTCPRFKTWIEKIIHQAST